MNESIDKLIAAAKEVGGAAWPMLVKQEYVNALVALIAGVLILLVTLALTPWVVRSYRIKDKVFGNEEPRLVSLLSTIAIVCTGLIGLVVIVGNLTAFLFPEGAALQHLLHR